MSQAFELVAKTIEENNAEKSASTRRQLVAGAAATLGGMGLLGIPGLAKAQNGGGGNNTPTNILNIAATAEVLATIVNTVGAERLDGRRGLDAVTLRNVRSAAREELIHYDVLTSLGARAATKRIWVPDSVFRSPRNLLLTLEAGDQIFINAYLIGVTAFASAGAETEARYSAEIMGVEAVHRALARQSLGKLGNDRAFMRYEFTDITRAVTLLQQAGFGFGERGKGSGRFYDFDVVRRRTPNPRGVNTRRPA